MTTEFERGITNMCNLSDGVEAKGIAKGIEQGIEQGLEQGLEQGTLSSLKNLIDTTGWSVEKALEALKVPEDDREEYIKKLGK